jgi:hypothetical protein
MDARVVDDDWRVVEGASLCPADEVSYLPVKCRSSGRGPFPLQRFYPWRTYAIG